MFICEAGKSPKIVCEFQFSKKNLYIQQKKRNSVWKCIRADLWPAVSRRWWAASEKPRPFPSSPPDIMCDPFRPLQTSPNQRLGTLLCGPAFMALACQFISIQCGSDKQRLRPGEDSLFPSSAIRWVDNGNNRPGLLTGRVHTKERQNAVPVKGMILLFKLDLTFGISSVRFFKITFPFHWASQKKKKKAAGLLVHGIWPSANHSSFISHSGEIKSFIPSISGWQHLENTQSIDNLWFLFLLFFAPPSIIQMCWYANKR